MSLYNQITERICSFKQSYVLTYIKNTHVQYVRLSENYFLADPVYNKNTAKKERER